jgi:hypothetical protein
MRRSQAVHRWITGSLSAGGSALPSSRRQKMRLFRVKRDADGFGELGMEKPVRGKAIPRSGRSLSQGSRGNQRLGKTGTRMSGLRRANRAAQEILPEMRCRSPKSLCSEDNAQKPIRCEELTSFRSLIINDLHVAVLRVRYPFALEALSGCLTLHMTGAAIPLQTEAVAGELESGL